jgi:hypothetical protein
MLPFIEKAAEIVEASILSERLQKPVEESQNRMVLSLDTDAIVAQLSRKAARLIDPVCPSRTRMHSPDLVFHIRRV